MLKVISQRQMRLLALRKFMSKQYYILKQLHYKSLAWAYNQQLKDSYQYLNVIVLTRKQLQIQWTKIELFWQ